MGDRGGRVPRGLVLILGALAALGPLAIDLYLPAFPRIGRDLGVELGGVQLTLAIFLLGAAVGQACYGPLADRWGRRGPLLSGLALYTLGALGCATAHSLAALIGWRLVMALGGSAGMVISRAVVRDHFNATESARIYSLLMLVMGVAPIVAPLLGGQLLRILSWRGLFLGLGGVGLAALVLVARRLPESLPPSRRQRHGVGSALRVYGRLMANRYILGHAIAAGCTSGMLFAYISGSPFVFIELHGVSPQVYGLLVSVNACGLVGAAQFNRWLLRKHSARAILPLALLANTAVGATLVATTALGLADLPLTVGLFFASMVTIGLITPNLIALAMAPCGAVAGSAAALLGAWQFTLGGATGVGLGLLQRDSALPLALTMAACGAIGFVSWRWLAGAVRTLPSLA